jgi:hypothetical protein
VGEAAAAARPTPGRALPAAASLLAVLAYVALLAWRFPVTWETNDDAAMAMVAHGYGLAAQGSPGLVFSNVLWGHAVRILPSIAGIQGYSLATLLALVASGWALAHHLARLGAGRGVALAATALALAGPVLFPQFTLTAGLLAVAAVLSLLDFARHGEARHLAAATALAFAAFLVRHEEAALVALVAAALLPWRALLRDRRAWLALALAAVGVAGATALDRREYAGADWAAFRALDGPRAQFTDYNAGVPLMERHPEIAARHGYTQNDLDLVGNYFFADPALADPAQLQAMLDELGPLPAREGSASDGVDSVRALLARRLLPLTLAGWALWALWPSRRVALAWGVFAGALFALGASGRPAMDVLRIYVPVLVLLVAAPPALAGGKPAGWRRVAALVLLGLALAGSAWELAPRLEHAAVRIQRAAADLPALGTGPFAVWGNAYPYSAFHPVFGRDPRARALRIDSLGTDTLAPYSVSVAERAAGHGLLDRLRSESGLRLVASDDQLRMLEGYCRERLHGRLARLREQRLQLVSLRTVRCVPG